MIKRILGPGVLAMGLLFSSFVRAQDSQTTQEQGNSTVTNTADGNTTANTSQDPTTQPASGNATTLTPEAIAAEQQQQQQLSGQFFQQLVIASPDDQIALIATYRAQLNSLRDSVKGAEPIHSQQSQQELAAAQQAFAQTHTPEEVLQASVTQEAQQLLAQTSTATPEQSVQLIAQARASVAQKLALLPAAIPHPPTDSAVTAQAQAALMASLPADQQLALQAQIQRQQALDALSQLSPDDRVSALQTIRTLPVPVFNPGATLITGSGMSEATNSTVQSTSSNISQP